MTSNNMEHENGVNARSKKTLTILGCGALGTAILSGILASNTDLTAGKSAGIFSHFVGCVRRKEAAKAIRDRLGTQTAITNTEILECQNLNGVKQAEVILLACQPHMYKAIIDEPGMREALRKKLIISVLAGVTAAQIESALGDNGSYFVIRAMPNIACFVRDSATVIESPPHGFPDSMLHITDTIFRCVGSVFYIKTPIFDVCTALCGSSPAFFAVIVDAMVDGAVAMGLGHLDALQMAAHAMRGTANVLLDGRKPWTVRHEVASPAGSTMQGLLELEQGNVRSTISNALIIATKEAKKLGTKDQEH